MKSLAVAIAFLATDWAFAAGVELELRSAKAQQLVLESPELRVFLINRGKEPVSVPLSGSSVPSLRIETADGWFECMNVLTVCAGVGEVRWTRMEPGGEVDMGSPPLVCPSGARDAHGEVKSWVEVPARYRLQTDVRLAVHELSEGGTSPTDNMFTGSLTSKTVSIEVNEPSGVDAQALTWALKHNDSPMAWAVVKVFPSSHYAALALLPYVAIRKYELSRVKTLIERGQFLAWGSVPDSDTPDGWAELSGNELAEWRIERARQILRDHPDVPFAGQLRLAIGVNQIASGKATEGRKLLRQLADHPETPEGAWAKEFLSADGS